MSSHYINLICPAPDCTRSESIYTGSILTDCFEAALDYEGATIDARCDEHSNWVAPAPEPESAPEGEVTAAVRRAAEAIRASVIDTPTEKAAPIMARAGLAAALDVEEIARAIQADQARRHGWTALRWEHLDERHRDAYRADAIALRAAILGGAA